jgi:methylthioribose-1-phosphate isomerase
MLMRTVDWQDDQVRMIDQRLLPARLVINTYTDYRDVATAIQTMVVRGAPAIGATAGFGMALAGLQSGATERGKLLEDLESAAEVLRASRPTAANLFWAVNRLLRCAADPSLTNSDALRQALVQEAKRIADEDVEINKAMGRHGATLIKDGDNILHHCNTGALAAVDYGTALGVIRTAHEQGKRIHVFVDETRPRLQGARLTAWELEQLGIPYTLIVDNAAGHFMRTGQVDLVMVGSDRTAANGDVANKIGTYKLAVVAQANGIPFYPVVPTSTIDLSVPSGDDIPIEERDPGEVTGLRWAQDDGPIAPENAQVANPAFDVTPHRYVTGIVTENGVAYPPFDLTLKGMVQGD